MPKKYENIYDQLLSNSKWNGECLESTYKVKSLKKHPQMTRFGNLIAVHRASWIYHKGKIPDGMVICHKCDNPKCFLIDHLFLGTPKDNNHDMIKKGRSNNFGRKKYKPKDWRIIRILRKKGYSYNEISKIVGIPLPAISAYCIRNKVKMKYTIDRKNSTLKKLLPKINEMLLKGYTRLETMKVLNINPSMYWRCKRFERMQQDMRSM